MTTTPETVAVQALSARTRETYGQDWALFTDWCAATGHPELPADPDTVLQFLTACHAARATQRCRVAAIDHHHRTANLPPPGQTVAVRVALGRPTGEPATGATNLTAVDAALRALPSHGWRHGMFGRRDRCLLVLSQLAGVPYRVLATVTAGDVTLNDGTATIRTPAGEWAVRPADDGPLVCGGCVVVRWLEVLQVAATRVATAEVAGLLKAAPEVTGRLPHVCRTPSELAASTRGTPFFSPIDQWGALPFPPPPLTPHSLSRRARDLLAGDLGAHRALDVDPPEPPAPDPQPAASPPRAVYSREDRAQAWERRRADLQDMAGITDVLTDVEQRADELNRRAANLLDSRP